MGLRDIPALSIYILSYELLYSEAKMRSGSVSNSMDCTYSLTAGGLAGVISWVLTMPIDTVKSKIQAQAASSGSISIRACIRNTFNTFGLSGLYRGMGIASIRAFPVNGVTFLVYSQVLHYLDNRHQIIFKETINVS